MDQTSISAIVGLLGAAIGGGVSFVSSWMTQSTQLRERHREAERSRREGLFNEFISEASRLYGDALAHQKDDISCLVQLYALVGRMRLVCADRTVTAAENVMSLIIETYTGPNRSLHELRSFAHHGGMNMLVEFGQSCREELRILGGSILVV